MALLLDRHPIGEEVLEFLHQFVSFSERDATLKLPLDVRVVVERIFRVDEHVGRPTSRAASTLPGHHSEILPDSYLPANPAHTKVGIACPGRAVHAMHREFHGPVKIPVLAEV